MHIINFFKKSFNSKRITEYALKIESVSLTSQLKKLINQYCVFCLMISKKITKKKIVYQLFRL